MLVDSHGDTQVPLDIQVASHPGDAVIEGSAVDTGESARHASSRVHQEPVAVAIPESAPQVAYVEVEASATTDPHHDQGSAATGRVEDASPDTHPAGPADEPAPEETAPPPEPAHEDPPAPTPEPAAEHHDDTTAATPEADHTT